MRAEADARASFVMSFEFEDGCIRISNIIANYNSTFSCDDEVVLTEGMPLPRLKILNFFLQSVFLSICSERSLTNIADIYNSVIAAC